MAGGTRRAAIALALLVQAAAPALAQPVCPGGPPVPPLPLPHLRHALIDGVEGIIVALGSSSTQGAMASDLAHSYPAELQQALSNGLPYSHVAVINRGISGQDAGRELARLEADVLAVRPQLVIWQVGANSALRKADPAKFRELVSEGVRRLEAAGMDVILMDNQQTPRLLALADEPEFDQTLAQVAAATGAGLFSRRALMLAWQRGGAQLAAFTAKDGLHQNDLGYFCVSKSLARAILAGLAAPEPLTASR